jgi:predicted trehalose synthase
LAGLLRSIDRAAAVSMREGANIRPESRALVASWAEDWRVRAKAACLEGYGAGIGDCPSYPASGATAFLDLFMLEKALIELHGAAATRSGELGATIADILAMIEQKP